MISETQKILASLSGAVAVHVVLLFVIFLILGTSSIGSSLSRPEAASDDGPKEVTILFGDLVEQIEPEPPEPETEKAAEKTPPEPEEKDFARPFIDTDLNRPEAEAPEDARFESDRNTRAAAELAPDPNLPQRDGPTTVGDLPIDRLTLQKREYVDGELDRPAAPPGMEATANEAVSTVVTPPGAAPPGAAPPGAAAPEGGFPAAAADQAETENADRAETAESMSAPESDSESGEEEEERVGADRPPEEKIAEERTRPEESKTEGEAEDTRMQRSYTLPDAAPGLPAEAEDGPEDRFAAERPETEDPVGDARDLEETMEARPGNEPNAPEKEATSATTDAAEQAEPTEADQPGMNPADQGIFADGFSPEQMQSTANGTLTNVGQNAVDAEATPVGKYKKIVRDLIAKKWHQYRVENAEHVTWGILKLKCRVDRFGKVHDLRVVENKANTMLADFSLRAILEADLPPMPREVSEELGAEGLELNYDIIIY